MLQLIWLTLVAGHIAGAAVWWWLTPHGFPSDSGAFWLNEVAPVLAMIVFAAPLVARGRIGQTLFPPVLASIPAFWIAFAIAAKLQFPESFGSWWNLPFLAGAALVALWLKQFRLGARAFGVLALVIPAAVAGACLPGSVRAPEPGTTPSGAPLVLPSGGAGDHKVIRLTKDAQMHPSDGRVVLRRDAVVLNVQPLLTFADRSPDRGWTALASPEQKRATSRSLQSKSHDGGRWQLVYKDEDASLFEVDAKDNAITIDARSRLAAPIYSHANTFAELTLKGHQKLSVSFSPIPDRRFALAAPSAPAQFAYVDGKGIFHVAQASERQRGPFTELARGPLARKDPLTLTLYDANKAVFSVTLDDWAAQASTQLSPTAGWEVPVNVIELVRGGDPESAPVLISLSLAANTIGRGTQTTGHAAGVYRNRMTIRNNP